MPVHDMRALTLPFTPSGAWKAGEIVNSETSVRLSLRSAGSKVCVPKAEMLRCEMRASASIRKRSSTTAPVIAADSEFWISLRSLSRA